jgi:hypothetical protein
MLHHRLSLFNAIVMGEVVNEWSMGEYFKGTKNKNLNMNVIHQTFLDHSSCLILLSFSI